MAQKLPPVNVMEANFSAWKEHQWSIQRLRDEYKSLDSVTQGYTLAVILGTCSPINLVNYHG